MKFKNNDGIEVNADIVVDLPDGRKLVAYPYGSELFREIWIDIIDKNGVQHGVAIVGCPEHDPEAFSVRIWENYFGDDYTKEIPIDVTPKKFKCHAEIAKIVDGEVEANNEDEASEIFLKLLSDKFGKEGFTIGDPTADEVEDED